MLKTQRMKDNSEIIPYQDPRLPLYVATGKLSLFYNMTPLCHWHDELEYIRPECGCMYYYINGEKIILKEGEAVLINSRQMHYSSPYHQQDCTYQAVLFRTQLLTGSREIARKYICPITQNPSFSYIRLYASQPGHQKIMDLFQRICQNYRKKLSLQEIAEAGNVSRNKCCSLFKQFVNQTPLEFLNSYRLESSIPLLLDTSRSITEVALSSGYQGSSYYAEIFRRYKGLSPSEYRKKNSRTVEQ
ncbi:MAG TPA: helix-turn-helix transcriptional regulator [Candidatus Pullilachnospira intestinigallinarum]|nr:helix-turn-helix transcriptional regulator [Candidatus Pullilachnospira intestinigallinarum]